MKFPFPSLLAAVLLTLSAGALQAQSTVVYNAATTTADPQIGAEHFLQQLTVSGVNGGSFSLTSFQVGVNYQDTTKDCGIQILFYTGLDLSTNSTNVLANATLLGAANGVVNAPNVPNGNYTLTFTPTSPIALGNISTVGVAFTFYNGAENDYGTGIINGRFTASAPTVGSSPGYVWNDANLDGTFTGAEQTTFGQTLANVRFSMTGTVPEPGTYALCGLGLAGLGAVVFRRRSARA